MYTLDNQRPEMLEISQQSKALLEPVLSALDFPGDELTIPGGTVISQKRGISQKQGEEAKIYFIREGVMKLIQEEKLIYFLDSGDLLGVDWICQHSTGPSLIEAQAEFAVKVIEYSWADFTSAMVKKPELFAKWSEYLFCVHSWHCGLLGTLSREEAVFSPTVCMFQNGETIIEQGSLGDQVFTLIEGRADVIVDGVKVGEIKPEEMFGAVALLTKQARSASVIATTDCMAVVLSKEQFMNLAQNRPDSMLKLAEDLSRAILSLNDRLTGKVNVPT